MTSTGNPAPAAFTSGDYAARMARVVKQAQEEGLTGVIVAPGPDLV
jgi:D-alanyl-D-alanine dipeptidase